MTVARESRRNRWGNEARFYKTPAGEFVSVTSVLRVIAKEALIGWAAKMEREYVLNAAGAVFEEISMSGAEIPRAFFESTVLDRLGNEKAHTRHLATAGDTGTEAHALCERHNRERMGLDPGPEVFARPEARNAFQAYKEWADSVNLTVIAVERVCWSETFRYAGCLDFRCEIDGVDVLGDIKTGKSVYREAHFQVGAYATAEAEMGRGMAKKGLIVRLPKKVGDPQFEIVEVPDLHRAFGGFKAALDLWKFLNQSEEA